jgi:hypothetical protein
MYSSRKRTIKQDFDRGAEACIILMFRLFALYVEKSYSIVHMTKNNENSFDFDEELQRLTDDECLPDLEMAYYADSKYDEDENASTDIVVSAFDDSGLMTEELLNKIRAYPEYEMYAQLATDEVAPHAAFNCVAATHAYFYTLDKGNYTDSYDFEMEEIRSLVGHIGSAIVDPSVRQGWFQVTKNLLSPLVKFVPADEFDEVFEQADILTDISRLEDDQNRNEVIMRAIATESLVLYLQKTYGHHDDIVKAAQVIIQSARFRLVGWANPKYEAEVDKLAERYPEAYDLVQRAMRIMNEMNG